MTNNRFNLIDEPWIPVANVGRVSLRQIFSEPSYKALGGNPVQKIAVTKLLLAIAQSAFTPQDEKDWAQTGAQQMAGYCLSYLEKWRDRFWLYGEKPFLQMPEIQTCIDRRKERKIKEARTIAKKKEAIEKAKPKSIGIGSYPDLPATNNTVLSHTLIERPTTDAEKAMFILTTMNFSFSGKRVEADLISLGGQKLGSRYSGKPGPSIGNYNGYLHSFVTANSIINTLWLNLFTREKIAEFKYWTEGLGVPPWEQMPKGESCPQAQQLLSSYMGCLIALSKFVFIKDDGIFYLDGINYPSHKEGWREPTMAIDENENPPKLLWVNPEKRPWRELTALLSASAGNSGLICVQIKIALDRVHFFQSFAVWSGGLKVSWNSGDHSVKRGDDFVESEITLPTNEMGQSWYTQLKVEMNELETVAKNIYGATQRYFKHQMMEGDGHAKQATHLFWQLCERRFQDLVIACNTPQRLSALRKVFAGFAMKAYDNTCPRNTARQLDAWAKSRPNLARYLNIKSGGNE